MTRALLITVRLHEARYHGTGEWPPAPARLFQALVSGAARGASLCPRAAAFLEWLEKLPPPRIGAPQGRAGQKMTSYVPNNDLDAVGGDPNRLADIRVGKLTRPWLLERTPAFLYAWHIDEPSEQPDSAGAVVDQLFQFGRGIDMAWAAAELLEAEDLQHRFRDYQGVVYLPQGGGGGVALDCPIPGSLSSLERQFDQNRRRFELRGRGRRAQVIFRRPSKPDFRLVYYDAPPTHLLFDLRTLVDRRAGTAETDAPFGRIPLDRAAELVPVLRDQAVDRLTKASPTEAVAIERTLRNRDAPVANPPRARVVPLPSIGHRQSDRAIRRVLIEVPGNCPVPSEDVAWAFSGLPARVRVEDETGEVVHETCLTPSTETKMLEHYGIVGTSAGHKRWRTVTPAALPQEAARRRVDPKRISEDGKGGAEFAREQRVACRAVVEALRHAQVNGKVERVVVQREPFEARGTRAEDFARGTRFDKTRLWHVELQFDRLLHGPLVIGDGRYNGLGLMAPIQGEAQTSAVHAFRIASGLQHPVDPRSVARHLRRAVLSRVQIALGARRPLPSYFTGHEEDGSPSKQDHEHLAFHFDPAGQRLLVLPPQLLKRKKEPSRQELRHLSLLERALLQFHRLHAGKDGCLELRTVFVDPDTDPLLAPARIWTSATRYLPARHTKRQPPQDALVADVLAELRRWGLPTAEVAVLEAKAGPRGGVAGRLRLSFAKALSGPIALGRACHLGGGLFSHDDEAAQV